MFLSQRTLLPILVAALGSHAFGQSPFTRTAEVTDTLSGWRDVAPADLDGDGLNDLLVATGYGPGLKVFLSEGGGFFGDSYRTAVEISSVDRIETADLNGDASPDFLAASTDGSTWSLWTGLGDATGRSPVVAEVLTGLGEVLSLEVADMDGDGDVDFVVSSVGSPSTVAWYEVTAVGLDTVPNVLAAARASRSAVLDIDGDGTLDFYYVSDSGHEPVILPGLGGGAFGAPVRPFQSAPVEERFAAGDLDGDGQVDFVGAQGPNLEAFYGIGAFDFGAPVSLGAATLPNGRDLALVDFEGDGDLDIYLGEGLPGIASRGDTFENVAGAFIAGPPAFSFPWPLTLFADISGDGKLDAVGGGGTTVQVRVQGPVGHPTKFLNPANINAVLNNATLRGVLDVDGNGTLDVLGTISTQLFWYPGFGDLTFAAREPILTLGILAKVVSTADVTGDGAGDILTVELVSNGTFIELSENLGGGQLAARRQVGGLDAWVDAYTVDADDDGDLDIVGIRDFPFSSTPPLLFSNDGTGSFGVGSPLPATVGTITSLAAADIDLDGVTDFVAGADRQFIWAKGLGGGTFSGWAVLHEVTNHISELRVIDIDGDGLPDVHALLFGRPTWMRQSSLGTFDTPQDLVPPTLQSGSTFTLVQDFDGDGDVDVVYSTPATSGTAVDALYFENLGAAAFAPAVLLAPGERGPHDTFSADMDADGDLDVVYFGFLPSRIAVLVNETVPTAGTGICGPAADNSRGLAARATALGAPSASATELTLRASRLPLQQFGFFVGSRSSQSPMPVAGSEGSLCLAGSIGRYVSPGQVLSSGVSGSFDVVVNPTGLRDGTGITPAVQGETWFFQAWFRDVTPQGAASSNFTDAVAVEFF